MTQDTEPSDPGEARIEAPLTADAHVVFIGRLRTPFARPEDCPRQGDIEAGPECRAVLDPVYLPALQGLEPGATLDLLYWLDRSRRDLLTQSRKSDGAPRGTFSLRSPVRPNPIGLSQVRLLRREGDALVLRGLDCVDGTPLLDIKPAKCPNA
ncbi:SAM-dependent methyltransferase [Pseudoponticoccus marisrubri]|uniref:tRNA-Thr(GGU) m(6)t(6)A37 methyltransferase TsaA n=1 Tax=Pseudoponticoccus marisrubri TaxID=1685382 RepID=A0A0W7WL69_9RHOB|nr:SAM-dependent methyltransferase [Pseudoponticoccus marisrubri]KUF11290.1 tRNA-Thr(GGU) m(6)t(6)A37 methyltransferase TsaA [Pseudoponticoccus marisrubri]